MKTRLLPLMFLLLWLGHSALADNQVGPTNATGSGVVTTLSLSPYSGCGFLVSAAGSGNTILAEGSPDNSTWSTRQEYNIVSQAVTSSISATGQYSVLLASGDNYVRIRVSVYGTGLITILETANNIAYPVTTSAGGAGSVTQGTSPWVDNITQIGGSTLTIGQQTAANSIPVILPSATITTLTPPSNTGYALDASINGILLAQASTTSGQSGPIIQASTTTSAPTYTTAKTNPLSLTTGGALRGDITTIAGTAPTTPGKLDVKGADGDVFVRQTTGTNLHAVLDTTSTTAVTQATGTNLHAVLDTTSTTAVTQATASNLNAQVVGSVADGVTDSGNSIKTGGIGKTTNPTAVTDGQRISSLYDKLGKQVVVGAIRDLKGIQQTNINSSTGETTIVTQVASTFLDLYGLVITNNSATVTKVTIKDSTSGTTRAVFEVPATETRGFMLPVDSAMPQATVNTNWTATCGTSVSSVDITALYVKNL